MQLRVGGHGGEQPGTLRPQEVVQGAQQGGALGRGRRHRLGPAPGVLQETRERPGGRGQGGAGGAAEAAEVPGQGLQAAAGDLGQREAGGAQGTLPGGRRAPGGEQGAGRCRGQGRGPVQGATGQGVEQGGGLADQEQPGAGVAGQEIGDGVPAAVRADGRARAVAVVVALHRKAGLAQTGGQLAGEPGHLVAGVTGLHQYHELRHEPAPPGDGPVQAGVAGGARDGGVRVEPPGDDRHRLVQVPQRLAQGGGLEQVVGRDRQADGGERVPRVAAAALQHGAPGEPAQQQPGQRHEGREQETEGPEDGVQGAMVRVQHPVEEQRAAREDGRRGGRRRRCGE